MSITFKTKIVIVAAVGLSIGFFSRYLMAKDPSQRRPASVGQLPVLKPLKIGKHLAALTAEINVATAVPEKEDQEVELIGTIQVQQNLEGDLSYAWDLPEGVHLVSGQLEDGLSNVQIGQTVELKLTVTGFSKESQKVITLQTHSLKGGLQIGNSAVISSRSEDTWEAIAPQMKEEATLQLEKLSEQARSKEE